MHVLAVLLMVAVLVAAAVLLIPRRVESNSFLLLGLAADHFRHWRSSLLARLLA